MIKVKFGSSIFNLLSFTFLETLLKNQQKFLSVHFNLKD